MKKVLICMLMLGAMLLLLPTLVAAANIEVSDFAGWAAAVASAGEDDVIVLTDDITILDTTSTYQPKIIYTRPLTVNLNNHTLSVTAELRFLGNTTFYGGMICINNVYSNDGFFAADYNSSYDLGGNLSVYLTFRDVEFTIKNSQWDVSIFRANDSNDTVELENVTIKIENTDAPGTGIFYSANIGDGGNFILKNCQITADQAKAVFFGCDVEISDTTIEIGSMKRPMFRSASGAVSDSELTVQSMTATEAEDKVIIADVMQRNPITLTFNDVTFDTPDGIDLVYKAYDDSVVIFNTTASAPISLNFYTFFFLKLYQTEYEITVETVGDGTVASDDDDNFVRYLHNITFTAVPGEGSELISILLDGEEVAPTAENEFTLEKVKAAHTVTFIFSEIE